MHLEGFLKPYVTLLDRALTTDLSLVSTSPLCIYNILTIILVVYNLLIYATTYHHFWNGSAGCIMTSYRLRVELYT
jgi:hypothetical protein